MVLFEKSREKAAQLESVVVIFSILISDLKWKKIVAGVKPPGKKLLHIRAAINLSRTSDQNDPCSSGLCFFSLSLSYFFVQKCQLKIFSNVSLGFVSNSTALNEFLIQHLWTVL